MSTDPFTPPRTSSVAGPPSPSAVRAGAALALFAEIGVPLVREAAIWRGLLTADGTAWLGVPVVAVQVSATFLVASHGPRILRSVVIAVGLVAMVVVPASWMGWVPEPWVHPATRATLGAIEVSQAVAVALTLRRLDRHPFSWIAWLSAIGTVASAGVAGTGLVAGRRLGALLFTGVWLGSRALRYVALLRLVART